MGGGVAIPSTAALDLSLSRIHGYERELIWRTEEITQEILVLVHQIDLTHLKYALTGVFWSFLGSHIPVYGRQQLHRQTPITRINTDETVLPTRYTKPVCSMVKTKKRPILFEF